MTTERERPVRAAGADLAVWEAGEGLRPGFPAIWGREGRVPAGTTRRMLQLMGEEVIPALRELGNAFELEDAFECEHGSRALGAGGT